jgi:hypothetical protein
MKSDTTDLRTGADKRRSFWWLALPVLLVTAFLGIRGLNADAIWYDEYWSLEYSGGTQSEDITPAQTWINVAGSEHELNPPGYYILLNLWTSVAGWSPLAVRSLSLFLGLIGMAWVYRLGRDMRSPLVGLLAVLGIGASAFYVYYLHEARAYALFPLFGAMSLWGYWRIQTGHAGRRADIVFFLGVFGSLYTHYLAGMLVIMLAFYHLFFGTKNRGWWRVVILMGLAGLLFLPWVSETLSAVNNVGSTTGRDSFSMSFGEAWQLLGYGFSNGLTPLALVILFGAAMSRGRAVGLVWFLSITVLVVSFIGDQYFPFLGHIRYLMSLVPLWALLFAFSVDWYRQHVKVLAWALVGVWLAMGMLNGMNRAFDDTLFREIYLPIFRPGIPLNQMADVMADNVQDGDGVAFYAPEYPWAIAGSYNFYMSSLGLQSVMLDQFPGEEADDEYYRQVVDFLDTPARVWVAREPGEGEFEFQWREFERALNDLGFTACPTMTWEFSALTLQLYSKVEGCCCPPDDLSSVVATFDNGVTLTYTDPLPRVTDRTVRTTFAWMQDDDVPRETYSIALHVLDTDGELVAQTDYGLPDKGFQCVSARVDVSLLPPGQYSLALILYEWQSGERVNGTLMATGERGNILTVASFRVE